MIASDIINLILQRYKMLCTKYPQSPSFIPNNKGDSFYLIRKRSGNLQPTQIRLSNHGTYLETWVDREELGESVERLNPAFCINISIVFVDEGEDLTNDCKGMSNCEGCEIEPCIPQTFEGQDELGRPFKVLQYIYNSRCIRNKYINGITKAIMEASIKGEYKDPLANLYRAAKEKELHSSTKEQNKELNTEQYMNKKLIRLTESDLHRIVKEAVNSILTEVGETDSGYISQATGSRKIAESNAIFNDVGSQTEPWLRKMEEFKLKYRAWLEDNLSNPHQNVVGYNFDGRFAKAFDDVYKGLKTIDYIFGH